jgi:putative tricarboxylic transport membrane protein
MWVCIAFGVIGYIMQKADMPSSPIILAVILGPMAESNLRRAVLMYEGSYSFLWTRPIAVVFLLLAALSLYSSYRRAHSSQAAPE